MPTRNAAAAPKPYPCPDCSRRYATEATLGRHVRTNHAQVATGAVARWDATIHDTYVCQGACEERLPATKFPTAPRVPGGDIRLVECRSCRNARTKAAKGAK